MNRIFLPLLLFLAVNNSAYGQNSVSLFKKTDLSVYDELSCEELYIAASHLQPQSQHVRSPLFNGQTDRFIFAFGTAYEPLFYYYGLYLPWHLKEELRMDKALGVLDYVRQRMARLRCFER